MQEIVSDVRRKLGDGGPGVRDRIHKASTLRKVRPCDDSSGSLPGPIPSLLCSGRRRRTSLGLTRDLPLVSTGLEGRHGLRSVRPLALLTGPGAGWAYGGGEGPGKEEDRGTLGNTVDTRVGGSPDRGGDITGHSPTGHRGDP